ncbi:hypothetical protein BWR19_15890 [Halomonas sp. 1513]|nr:hypothetical protein [Halomonas sp. 1513]APX94296.1 hypothetical protein BWR19_15890 [Halomonas sp. 1513]
MTPILFRELDERSAAARQRRDYHHRQFNLALANLRALGARCPGVGCRTVRAAGAALSKATRSELQAPFMAFADAILDHARTLPEDTRGEAVTRLANQAMDYTRDLEHHVMREATAQRELQMFNHLLASALAESEGGHNPGPGGAN